MIQAHLIDSRGVYLSTAEVDPAGAQPPGAVYVAVPEAQEGATRMWRGGVWEQVPDADVRPFPSAPTAAVRPARVPRSCTRRQGRLALLQHGLLDDVEDAVAAIEDPAARRAAMIEYEADTWERNNPFVRTMWAQLGGTPEQLDDLFRLAVTL